MNRRNFLQWIGVGAAGLVIPNARVWSFPKKIKVFDSIDTSGVFLVEPFIYSTRPPLPPAVSAGLDSIFVHDYVLGIPMEAMKLAPVLLTEFHPGPYRVILGKKARKL